MSFASKFGQEQINVESDYHNHREQGQDCSDLSVHKVSHEALLCRVVHQWNHRQRDQQTKYNLAVDKKTQGVEPDKDGQCCWKDVDEPCHNPSQPYAAMLSN